MDTQKLRAFYQVVREKNFSRAAEKLYITQPAVSQAIKLLEEELGEPLFVRSGKRAVLTPAGKILFEHVDQAFEMLEQGRRRIDALKELKEGCLTISTSDTIGCYLLPEVLKIFNERYPKVEIRILNAPSPVAARHVADRDSDVGIVTLPLEMPRVTVEPIITREDVVISHPDQPLTRNHALTLPDIIDKPFILLDKQSNTRRFLDRYMEKNGIAPRVVMELGNLEVVKKMVQTGFGVSVVPFIAVREEIERNTLWAGRIFRETESRVLGAAYLSDKYLTLQATEFIRIMKKYLASPAAVEMMTYSG